MKKLLISFLLLGTGLLLNDSTTNAQEASVSGINLQISNICDHYGQIVGCNGMDGTGQLPSFGNVCGFPLTYTHYDSIQLPGKLKYMNIEHGFTMNNTPQLFCAGDENTIYTSHTTLQPNFCTSNFTTFSNTILLDSIVECIPHNGFLFVIRNSTFTDNFLVYQPQSGIPFFSTTLNLKPAFMELNTSLATITGEGPNNEMRLILIDAQSFALIKDTALNIMASNPKALSSLDYPEIQIASSPGDTVVTLTRYNYNLQTLNTTVIYGSSGLGACDFDWQSFNFQPLYDLTGNNDDKKIVKYVPSSATSTFFNINKRLYKLIYASKDYYSLIHAIEESPGNNLVFTYETFGFQVYNSFTTPQPAEFVVTQFRCFVGLNEYDDHLVKISAYPNPANGVITIKASGLICGRDYEMDIINGKGEVLVKKTIRAKMHLEIPLDAYASGVYFLRIHTKKGILSERIVKI